MKKKSKGTKRRKYDIIITSIVVGAGLISLMTIFISNMVNKPPPLQGKEMVVISGIIALGLIFYFAIVYGRKLRVKMKDKFEAETDK